MFDFTWFNLPSFLFGFVFGAILMALFASLIVGGGLGAVCALVLRTLLTAAPGLRKVIILLP